MSENKLEFVEFTEVSPQRFDVVAQLSQFTFMLFELGLEHTFSHQLSRILLGSLRYLVFIVIS